MQAIRHFDFDHAGKRFRASIYPDDTAGAPWERNDDFGPFSTKELAVQNAEKLVKVSKEMGHPAAFEVVTIKGKPHFHVQGFGMHIGRRTHTVVAVAPIK